MANLIAAVDDGPWTTPETWMTCEAGAGAGQLTRSASTETTTSYVWSTAFTCTNADVMDGVLLHLKRVGVTGTITVAISADGGSTAAKEVTVNASDVPADQTLMFFKFPSTLTADGGADYKIGVKESAGGSGATVYRDGTAGNWFRLIRLTAAAGADPAAGDNVFVAGEWTAEATTTAINVVMDSTDSTDHGTVDIGQGGSVTFGVTAATAYVLKVSGDINIWSGGTLNVGTVGAEMPSDSSGWILLDCASNVQYGLLVKDGGTLVMQGASKTVSTFLASDEAANSTELTSSTETGWASGDVIVVASTTRTAAQSETGDLNGAASGTTLTVHGFGGAGGGLAYAHSGTAPTRAEIINLTRNVGVKGASASLQTYIYAATTATVNVDYAEFYWLGSATAGKKGIDDSTTTGTFNMQYSSLHAFVVELSIAISVGGQTGSASVFSNNVLYSITNGIGIYLNAGAGSPVVQDNFVITTKYEGIWQLNSNATISGNTIVSAGTAGSRYGLRIDVGATNGIGAISSNTIHSCPGTAMGLLLGGVGTISSTTAWRNSGYGLDIAATAWDRVVFDGMTLFGNTTANINAANSLTLANLAFRNIVSSGDSSFATTTGLAIGNNNNFGAVLESGDFSTVSGIKTAHTNDIMFGSACVVVLNMSNTKFGGSSVTLDSITDTVGVSHISSQRHGQTAGDHRYYTKYGLIQTDSVIYKTAAPSERITPSSATVKIESAKCQKVVDNAGTVTFNVYVRKSAAGDAGGVDYAGNEPRLVLKANPALGIDADVVLDTMTESVGNWEQLTGTSAAVTDDGVLEAIVDADGASGAWISVDDWS